MGIFDSLGGAQGGSQQPVGFNPQTSSLTPQQQLDMTRLHALQGAAATPYSGSAAGGGAAQGIAQLVAALLARKKAQQMQNALQPAGTPINPNATGGGQGPVPLPPQPSANAAAPPSFGLGGPP